jgi:hypothetical protein
VRDEQLDWTMSDQAPTAGADTRGWLDGRGCVTPAGMAAIAASPPGQVPPELASHLAACGRCQQRLLGGGQERPRVPPKSPKAVLGRALLVVGAALAAILGVLLTLSYLRSAPR